MSKNIRCISMLTALLTLIGLFSAFPLGAGAETTYANFALTATYKGTGATRGYGNYSEADWSIYHSGRLNDGTVPAAATDSSLGQNVEFYLDAFVSGTVYVYFKLATEVEVTDVKLYANCRETASNHGYPTFINVYVGDSEADTALFGVAVTEDTDYVREYSVLGKKKGSCVILEIGIEEPYNIVALGEVEIWGTGELASTTEKDALPAPVLTSSAPKEETFTVPTISWEAVDGASGYDVYLDGVRVLTDTAALSYIPDSLTVRQNYTAATGYKVQVVAKSGNEGTDDSPLSEAANIFYVAPPTDKNGLPLESADFVLDAGHGGADSGATNGTRKESDDNLAMTLAVGARLEALGFTVAYTRTTDVYESDRTKAAKCEAGNYKYCLSFHRNSFSNEYVNGTETLYQTGDAPSKAFADAVNAALGATELFTDRGVKSRNDLTLLNSVCSIPVILLELSYISCPSDNILFDSYMNDIAAAVAVGALTHAGYKSGSEGTVTVNGTAYSVGDTDVGAITLFNYGESTTVALGGDVVNGTGITGLVASVGDGFYQLDANITSDNTLDGYFIKDHAVFEDTLDFTDITPGTYTVSVFGTNYFNDAILCGKFQLLSIGVTVLGKPVVTFIGFDGAVIATVPVEYGGAASAPTAPDVEGYVFTGWNKMFSNVTGDLTVTAQYEPAQAAVNLGDVNGDGKINSLDAARILKYDAGIAVLAEDELAAADVNGDGKINSLDAARILKYDAGLIESF